MTLQEKIELDFKVLDYIRDYSGWFNTVVSIHLNNLGMCDGAMHEILDEVTGGEFVNVEEFARAAGLM